MYHVGESFFDKSLESAVRWCHEVAEMGVRRIGHAIALGMDPVVAVSRRDKAHERELVSERLDQISYDLKHASRLISYGVCVDTATLRKEQAEFQRLPSDQIIDRPYEDRRLIEIRGRQQFVLDHLCGLGTVIECCPTSNLRIGGIPTPEDHPIHRFLKSDVSLAICSDDPGNLDISLASEIEWVLQVTRIGEDELCDRLGNPRRHRLAIERTKRHSTAI